MPRIERLSRNAPEIEQCLRDREKIVRGIKKDDSVLIDGYQMYHNYFRPHMALDGMTPSEKCGIVIEGNNKWKTLIQNASMD
jgi:putative transposase